MYLFPGTNNSINPQKLTQFNESDVIPTSASTPLSNSSKTKGGNTANKSRSSGANETTPIHGSMNNSSIINNRTTTNNNQQQPQQHQQQQLATSTPSNQLFNQQQQQQNSQYNTNGNYSNQTNLNSSNSNFNNMVAAGQQQGGMDVGYNAQVIKSNWILLVN